MKYIFRLAISSLAMTSSITTAISLSAGGQQSFPSYCRDDCTLHVNSLGNLFLEKEGAVVNLQSGQKPLNIGDRFAKGVTAGSKFIFLSGSSTAPEFIETDGKTKVLKRTKVTGKPSPLGFEGITASGNGNLVALNDTFGNVWTYTTATFKHNAFIRPDLDRFDALALSNDGGVLAISGQDPDENAIVMLIDAKSGKTLRTLKSGNVPIQHLLFKNGQLVTASSDGEIILWSTADGKRVRQISEKGTGPLNTLAISPDGRWLAGGSRAISLWDTKTGERVARVKSDEPLNTLLWTSTKELIVDDGVMIRKFNVK